jgi:hypothetical protein
LVRAIGNWQLLFPEALEMEDDGWRVDNLAHLVKTGAEELVNGLRRKSSNSQKLLSIGLNAGRFRLRNSHECRCRTKSIEIRMADPVTIQKA